MKRMNESNRTRAKGLAIAAAVLALGVGPATAQPEEILLAGQVRDFSSDHPDFGLSSAVGGAVTGLMEFYGTAGRPQMQSPGNGIELTQNALDVAGREIAPHMFANGPENTGVFVLLNPYETSGNGVADHYDQGAGYDAGTAKPLPPLDTAGSIDPVTAPVWSPMPTKVASMLYKATASYKSGNLMAGFFWTDDFVLSNGFTLTIVGDVNIRVDKNFSVTQGSEIIIADGSSLTFWIGGTFEIRNSVLLNYNNAGNTDQWDHSRLTFYNFGTDTMIFDNHTDIVGTVVAPYATVQLSNSSEFYGAVTANSLTKDNGSGVHIAGEFAWVSDCFFADDTQPAAGTASAGQITSTQSFAAWFSETPDISAVDEIQLLLADDGSGNYQMSTTSWEPINDELLGNEDGEVNRNFTVDVSSIFFNRDCQSKYIEVETSMDCWVFIDDIMVIDLGGTTGNARQRIDLDRLGLADNTWHRVRFFIAQRLDGPQDLFISTSLPLTPPRSIAYRMETRHD